MILKVFTGPSTLQKEFMTKDGVAKVPAIQCPMPRVSWLGSTNNKTPSSRFLEDGSYVRLKNLQLGYTLPQKIISKWNIKNLRIYFTGQNLWTYTKYSGLDPEMHISDNLNNEKYRGDVATGIDWGTYPSAKSYVVGLNLNF